MKALIAPYSHAFAWCGEFFPERSLCSLPLAGKEFAEYLIDIASRLHFEEVLLLDYSFDADFQRRLGSGSRWSLKLAYRGARIRRNVPALLEENHTFVGDEGVTVFYGPVLPELDTREQLFAALVPAQPEKRMRDGVYVYRDGNLMRSQVPVRRMKSLEEYFDLNFQLLRSPRRHVLPGYRVENGVHTGMNVAIMPGCEVNAPVLLGDNICLERDCVLEDGVVVGRNVVIDRGNSLKHTVILSNTFVGQNMELHHKIVDSGRIIDPRTGQYIDLGNCGIAFGLRPFLEGIDRLGLFEYLLAAAMALLLAPFYGLCRLAGLLFRSELWAYKLSLDCYPGLWRVLRGKSLLIRRARRSREGVFCYSDSISIGRDRFQRRLDDIYFTHHRNPWLIVKTVVKAMINRVFTTHDTFQNSSELH